MRWAALLLALCAVAAQAQTYPAKPVRVIVPIRRHHARHRRAHAWPSACRRSIGQPFVVENRRRGGNIGAEAASQIAADGYTLLGGRERPSCVNRHLYKSFRYDPERTSLPISLLACGARRCWWPPSSPAQDFRAFIAARAAAGSPVVRLGGRRQRLAPDHGAAEERSRVIAVHVPYRGFPPAVTDLLGGNIDAMFAIIPAVLPQVRARQAARLAVTALERSATEPDVPSVARARLSAARVARMDRLARAEQATPARRSGAAERRDGAVMRQLRKSQESLGRHGFDVVAELAAANLPLDPR